MIATRQYRSLLDPIPGRMARDLMDDDQGDEDSPLGLYRAYRADMARESARDGWRPPDLTDALLGMIGHARADDAGRRRAIREDLSRAHYHSAGPDGFRLPRHMGLADFMYAGVQRAGTESLSGGSTYGFLVKPEYGTFVADRARNRIWPGSFVNIWEVPSTLEYKCGINSETNPAIASQFGGLMPNQFGHGELVLGALAADGKVGEVTIANARLLAYTIVSEDIWKDSATLGRWFHYSALAGFRNAIEAALIQGLPSGLGPRGVVNNAKCVKVTRQSGGTIGATDLDILYESVSSGSAENAVWVVSKPALKAIRAIASAGSPSALQFPRSWSPDDPFRRPTLYGRPVIESPYASALGTPGDVLIADFSQYALTWIRPRTIFSDSTVIPAGALEMSFLAPGEMPDNFHRGLIGMPLDSVEMRGSRDLLFDTDRMAIGFKYRGGGDFLTTAQTTTEVGVTVGPAAYLSS